MWAFYFTKRRRLPSGLELVTVWSLLHSEQALYKLEPLQSLHFELRVLQAAVQTSAENLQLYGLDLGVPAGCKS